MSPLKIWHIGGDGPIGPAQAILNKHKEAELVTFDARPEHGMPLCFDEFDGEADFYITRNGMASGLLRSAPAVAEEQCLWDVEGVRRVDVWGDITTVEKVERVRTTTVDAYAALHGAPDVLSLDVQGAEMRVLRGAVATLPSVLCCITEVEFWEIYAGQGLFDHQMAFMRERGFRLAGMYNLQPWHQGEPMGTGFTTVAEAIWLRFSDVETLTAHQLLKLTLISAIYDRTAFAKKVWNMAQQKMSLAGVAL